MIAAVLSIYLLAAFAPPLHRLLGRASGSVFALLPAALAGLFALWAGPVLGGAAHAEQLPWLPALGVELALRLDGLSLLMALLICAIGALVLVYASGYMGADPQLGRLYAFLLLFMASMLGLVLADNLLCLFVFWELTTVSSYLLIGYKHQYEKARKAALQGLLVTGMGGLALLAGLVTLGQIGGSYAIPALAAQGSAIRADPRYAAALALIALGAFTKSAQVPFHFWLPGAMEAPTPVSAYLHSATMVKAGVFLLARLYPALGGTPLWDTTMLAFGTITLLVGAWLALVQTDLKRILAYSTVAALGTLVLCLGLGSDGIKALPVFLLGHALYKGALFMVAGAVDHATGTRNVRLLGGLWRSMPLTAAAAVLAGLSMAGVPLLFGFIGKELVYKAALSQPLVVGLAVLANAAMAAAAGVAVVQPFFGRVPAHTHHGQTHTPQVRPAHEAPWTMLLGPLLLAAATLLLGIVPGVANALASAAAGAIAAAPKAVEMELYSGIAGAAGTALLLSALTLLLAAGLYAGRRTLARLVDRLRPLTRFGPERGYFALLDGTLALARWQTALLQNGSLRGYLKLTVITLLVLVGGARLITPIGLPPLSAPELYELPLAALTLAAAVIIVRSSSRLNAIIALGVVGLCVALVFLFFSGPDLAMTQFAIEVLSTVLFMVVIYQLPVFKPHSSRAEKLRDAAVAGGAGLLMTALTLAALATPNPTPLADFFAQQSLLLGKGLNVVNVIIVDFRGIDTLGEITVLGLAAIGIYALVHQRPADTPEGAMTDHELALLPLAPSEALLPEDETALDVEQRPTVGS